MREREGESGGGGGKLYSSLVINEDRIRSIEKKSSPRVLPKKKNSIADSNCGYRNFIWQPPAAQTRLWQENKLKR